VAAALISSTAARPLPKDAIYFGEIGLAGEVRAVSQAEARLGEAAKLGFRQAVIPSRKGRKGQSDGMTVEAIDQLGSLVDLIYGNDGRR
jgi:DNA repair protein RadA/Sms